MRKIRCIMEEFFRSFRRSVFKNILLMPMFAISLVMTVIMCSYYFDMGDRYSGMTQHIGDCEWYDLQIEDTGEMFNIFTTTAKGSQSMLGYYEDFCRTFNVFSAYTEQSVEIRETDIRQFFGKRDYTNLLNSEERESFLGPFGEDETCRQYRLNCVQADVRAYQMFGLRTVEGEGLTELNTVLAQNTAPIPIVLGNDYQGSLKVGDTIDLELAFYVYSCKVVGILEKGAEFPELGSVMNGKIKLDSYILFPYGIRIPDANSGIQELEKYAFLDYIALDNGYVQVEKESEVSEMVNQFQTIAQSYGLEPVRLMGTSMGVNLLRLESATSIRVLFILTIALLCFTFYGLFVTFYDKILSNSRIYGIYLANGCSLGMILVSCLLEIAVILFPGILLSWYLFTVENMGFYNMGVLLQAAYLFAGLAFLAGGIFIAVILRGVDTELLLRQKE